MRQSVLKREEEQRLFLLIALAGLGILFLTSISLTMSHASEDISMTVVPEVPREGLPVIISFALRNPGGAGEVVRYRLYGNGMLLSEGEEYIEARSVRRHVYAYPKPPEVGEKMTFLLRAESERGVKEKSLAIPPYPPQVWSSFVSFATFSTAMMSSSISTSIASLDFYERTFLSESRLNIGLVLSMFLIAMLVFLELTEPLGGSWLKVVRLRLSFTRLSIVLFLIFLGMVASKVVLVLR